jgi:hypothetical protein
MLLCYQGNPENFMPKRLIAAAFIFSACSAQAQSLSPEDIQKMVDQRMQNLNPYQELLNNPDPMRSLAAMQIMMESGDAELVRMATEFGLLSPNPTVKRTAFESFLATGPILSFRFDGSEVKDSDYARTIRGNWNGTLAPDKTGYWRIKVTQYLPEEQCFGNSSRPDRCFVTVNSDGVFLTPDRMNARATVGEDGRLNGTASLNDVDEPVPFTAQLID